MRMFAPCLGLGVVLASAGSLHAQTPSYTKDVRPFLEKYCMGCHQGTRAKGSVNLESFATLMKGSKKGRKTVIPGQADNSRLVTCVEGTGGRKMPPKKAANQPSAKEIEVLRAWVNGGAKNDMQKQSRREAIDDPARQRHLGVVAASADRERYVALQTMKE